MHELVRFHAKVTELKARATAVQQAHDDFFTMYRRQCADTEIDLGIALARQFETSILGDAPFGYVKPGKDFYPGNQPIGKTDGRRGALM